MTAGLLLACPVAASAISEDLVPALPSDVPSLSPSPDPLGQDGEKKLPSELAGSVDDVDEVLDGLDGGPEGGGQPGSENQNQGNGDPGALGDGGGDGSDGGGPDGGAAGTAGGGASDATGSSSGTDDGSPGSIGGSGGSGEAERDDGSDGARSGDDTRSVVAPALSYGDAARKGAIVAAGRALRLAGPLAPPLALAGIAVAALMSLGRTGRARGLMKDTGDEAPAARVYRL